MALTGLEVKQLVENYVYTNPGFDWAEWNDETYKYGLHHKFYAQLEDLQVQFQAKLKKLYDNLYQPTYETLQQLVSVGWVVATDENTIIGLKDVKEKAVRISKKWRAVNAEIAGRDAGEFGPGLTFDREYHGTDYYIDLDNGQDTRTGVNPDGLQHGNYTADSGTGTTTLVETSELARTSSGDWDGAYIYNVTRSAGALITNSVYSAGTWTLTHGTIASQASGDTYYILDSWLTIGQYTTSTTRSPGDNGYVRANTSQVLSATVVFDEDGNYVVGHISIIGCDSATNDPWGDSSDVLPQVDFNDSAAVRLDLNGDEYWWFERLDFRQGGWNNQGSFRIGASIRAHIKDCEFNDNISTNYSLQVNNYTDLYIEGCALNGLGTGLYVSYATAFAFDCTFDGHGSAMYAIATGRISAKECAFGNTTTNTNDAFSNSSGIIYLLACSTDTANNYNANYGGKIYVEDEDGFNTQRTFSEQGTVIRNTTTTRSGGGDSIEMAPGQSLGKTTAYSPMSISGGSLSHGPDDVAGYTYRKWMDTGSQTLTMYIRAKTAWSPYPTSSQLYLKASYISNATTGARTEISSTAVLTDGSTWVAFSVTVNPAVASMVHFDVFLALWQSGAAVLIDEIPVIS